MDPFLGQMLLVPYNFAPLNWQFCQGQVVSISAFSALFSLLGTQYGGNGTSTFGLPELRGRVAVHQGQGPGLSSYGMGEMSGSESVTLRLQEMAGHNHTAMGVSQRANQSAVLNDSLADAVNSGGSPIDLYVNSAPNTLMNVASIGFTGGNLPHENRMPYLTLNWVIAMVGVYPQRS